MLIPSNLGRVVARSPRTMRGVMGELGVAAAHAHAVDTRARLDIRQKLRFVPRLNGLGFTSVHRATAVRRLHGLGETSCSIDPLTGGRVCASGPAGPAPAAIAPAPVSNIPPAGSYLQTCRNITSNGTTVNATCETIGGAWVPTSLYFPNCAGDIANINGVLQCNVPQGPSSPAAAATGAVTPGVTLNPQTGQPYPLSIPVGTDPFTGVPYASEWPYNQPPYTTASNYVAPYSSPQPSLFVPAPGAARPVKSSLVSGVPNIALYAGGAAALLGIGWLITRKGKR